MTKLFTLSAILALAVTSSFADTTATAGFEADGIVNTRTDQLQRQVYAAVKHDFSLASVDARVTSNTDGGRPGVIRHDYEMGVSRSYSIGGFSVTPRLGLGQAEESSFYRLGVEGKMPVATGVAAFAGYDFRSDYNTDPRTIVNRFQAGADFAVVKNVSARAGIQHARADGTMYNGVIASVSYKF